MIAPSVLVAVHGHPALNVGGSEVAAAALFESLVAAGHPAWLLGCDSPSAEAAHNSSIRQPFEDARQYVYRPGAFDFLRLANRDAGFAAEFGALLAFLRPDVLHLHHALGFGVEAAAIARRAHPGVTVVLTLHDYMLACHHDGQMVTRGRQSLCTESSDRRCAGCFPEVGEAAFSIRRAYLRRFLGEVDAFVSPSAFLAARMRASGLLHADPIVIPNVLPKGPGPFAERSAPRPGPLRVGFFGQVTEMKGVGVLLAAAALCNPAKVAIKVHGAGATRPDQSQADLERRLAGASAPISWRGPYQRGEVGELMRACDLVVVPSIWWENAPIVITEARLAGVPVACSGIGGMAEMVDDGVDGLHFDVGSPASLAALLTHVSEDRSVLSRLHSRPSPGIAPFQQYIDTYVSAIPSARVR